MKRKKKKNGVKHKKRCLRKRRQDPALCANEFIFVNYPRLYIFFIHTGCEGLGGLERDEKDVNKRGDGGEMMKAGEEAGVTFVAELDRWRNLRNLKDDCPRHRP